MDFILVNIVVAIFVDALLAQKGKKPQQPKHLLPLSPRNSLPTSNSNLFHGVSNEQIPKRFSLVKSRSGKGYTWRGIANYQE
jgi:hypothetical protein